MAFEKTTATGNKLRVDVNVQGPRNNFDLSLTFEALDASGRPDNTLLEHDLTIDALYHQIRSDLRKKAQFEGPTDQSQQDTLLIERFSHPELKGEGELRRAGIKILKELGFEPAKTAVIDPLSKPNADWVAAARSRKTDDPKRSK